MRKIILFLIVAGLILAITGWTASKSVAQSATCRPWCVHYGAGGGGTNCGFISLEQCTWTAQGAGICLPIGACPPGIRGSYDNWSASGDEDKRADAGYFAPAEHCGISIRVPSSIKSFPCKPLRESCLGG
jgi:Protein of unknown function (DUF3551)